MRPLHLSSLFHVRVSNMCPVPLLLCNIFLHLAEQKWCNLTISPFHSIQKQCPFLRLDAQPLHQWPYQLYLSSTRVSNMTHLIKKSTTHILRFRHYNIVLL